ncbi:MAG: hypothetical protein JKY65_31115 [Planctomycetes bacterium]|nr:hypothetical protein [Planctomycetota bacterium]
MMRRVSVLSSLLLVGLSGPVLFAGGPDTPPGDSKKADPKKADPKKGDPKKAKKALETAPERHARLLKETTVHFDFKRAPIEDILRALSKASEVPIALGRKAKTVLDKRRFKIRYVASRRGDQVLTDLCKAAALDFVIRDKGVLVDLPGRIRKLRKSQNLGGQAVKLTPKDVTKALTSKTLSMTATKRSLESVLLFLRTETGIPIVQLSEKRKRGAPPLVVTIRLSSVPLKELLDKILAPLGLDWIQQGRVILVGSIKAIAEQREAAKPKGRKKPVKEKAPAKPDKQKAGKPADERGKQGG